MNKFMAAAAFALFMTAPAFAKNSDYRQEFSQFDANGDGVISRSEFPGDAATFNRMDHDRNGVITLAETHRFIQSGDWESELHRIDRNGDGIIQRSEWNGDRATFDRLDRNHDGVLSQADREVRRAAKKTNRFRGMDRNGDGVISRSEWRGNDQSFRQHDRNRDGVISGREQH